MKYSYNWLKEYVANLPEPKKLVELLTMRAFEVESCEKLDNDYVLDIKVLPNRAFDCLSHIGIAREIGAIGDYRLRTTDYRLIEDKSLKIKDFLNVEVEDKKLCPRYSARVMVDIKVAESPDWLKDKLIVCGLRPINNVVDITNYLLLEYGQPMHAFDFDKLATLNRETIIRSEATGLNTRMNTNDTNKKMIIVRRAKKSEKIISLDGEERELDESILIIADSVDPIAIAGIKGGKKAEIDNKTTKIVLESANFEPVSTRKSSKALNLRTDASIRFENGLDINLAIEALDKAASMIAELCGGKIVSGIADSRAAEQKQITTAVSHNYAESLLGIKMKSKEILDIFKRLDLPAKMIKKKNDVFYEIFVPSRRNDLNTQEDLIEEIGRIYGYENIPAVMPTSVLVPSVKNEELINEEKARNIMVGAGYSEVYNYSLISEDNKKLFDFEMAGPRYPLSNDQKYLRSTLIIRLLENVGENLKYFDNIKIFEIGKIFRLKEKNIEEKRMIAGILCGPARNASPARQPNLPEMQSLQAGVSLGGHSDAGGGGAGKNIFYEAKGAVDLLLEKMGVSEFNYGSHGEDKICKKAAMFDSVKRAKVISNGKELGWVGKINKNILLEMKINQPVAVFELNFDLINQLIEEEIEYRAPSKYPAIERDLSVLVSQEIKIDDVLNIIDNVSGPLAINIDLIDIYEDNSDKSLTFRLVFQSWEKNLTDVDVNKVMGEIIEAVEGEGWEIRR